MKSTSHNRGTGAVVARLALIAGMLPFFLGAARSVSANPDAPFTGLYFAAVDSHTTLYLTNPQTPAASVIVTPYDPSTGTALVATPPIPIPAGGSVTVLGSSLGLTVGKTYGVTVTSTVPVQGVAFFQDLSVTADGLAVYNGASTLVTSGHYGPVFANYVGIGASGQITTDFHIYNPSATDSVVTLEFRSETGSKFDPPVTRTIGAGKSLIIAIGPDLGYTLPVNFWGWVGISATSGVAITQLQRSTASIEANAGMTAGVLGADTLYHTSLPRVLKSFADGLGGSTRSTLLALVNTSGVEQTISFTFHPVGSPAVAIAETLIVPGNYTVWFNPSSYSDLPAGKVYQVDIAAPGLYEVSEETVADLTNIQAGGYPQTSASGSLLLSGIVHSPAAVSQVTVQNLGPLPASLSFSYLDASGTPVFTPSAVSLAAGASQRIDLRNLSGLGASFAGSLLVQSTPAQPLAARVDEFLTNGQPFYKIAIPITGNNFWVCSQNEYANDDYYSYVAWDMQMTGADKLFANCLLGSQSVVVAVVDTGVDLTHPDLKANLLPGYDFVQHDTIPQDGEGHGTHVAGTIAARINGIGVVGVAPMVKILPVRVLDNTGSGYTSDVIAGIKWAADHGARVINLSLGSTHYNVNMKAVVDYAIGKGAVVIAAAGNDGDGYNLPCYPAAYPEVVAVAAVDANGRHAFFSNYGSYVDIAAPGEKYDYDYLYGDGIFSTFLNGGYTAMSGTSMASPHVAGEAAQILSRHPEYTVAQVIAAIEGSALHVDMPYAPSSGRNDWYGYGIIQVDQALDYSILGEEAQVIPQDNMIEVDQRTAPIAHGYVMLHVRAGADEVALAHALAGLGLTLSGSGADALVGEKITVPAGQEWQMVDRLRKLDGVQSADPDYVVTMN
jgi:hypothetical protein